MSAEILQLLSAPVLLQVDRLPRPEDAGDPHVGGEVRPLPHRAGALPHQHPAYRRLRLRLGHTVNTLIRACAAATGQPVKHVIDGRVALEARRLLAPTDEPVAAIARCIGFPRPTNFGMFFARHTGMPLGAFRRVHQSRHATSGDGAA
ncbi:helix-turn-helix domain-containing protein [Streptomyces sp. NPDC101110]|uniref:helix-turn-helix domain-containing protein n=1 Tax=Streptomyces sp. NPDC101110 TaxID=3366104 RepID=UPI003824C4EC